MTTPSRPAGPRLLIFAALAVAAVGVAALFGVFSPREPDAPPQPQPDQLVLDEPLPDPRVAYPTPFRNVKPGVKYLGDASCVNCHREITERYRTHPMGRSAEFTSRATPIEKYDGAAKNPFQSGPFTLRVEQTPNGVTHRVSARDAAGRPLPDYAVSSDLAIGSGTRGRSYLTIESGCAWQSPISWYGPDARWDLSPGFDLGNGGRRPIPPECLFCHVDRVEPVPGSLNRYREPLIPMQAAIGCERCHGPGELHAAEQATGKPAGKPDASIVNPRHLAPALQSAICEQCHLQGQQRVTRQGMSVFDFRPGLPFEQFVTVFVRHPDLSESHRSVGQFEQMEASRCFTAAGGRMVCTSCHDPHGTPPAAGRDAFYRGRCLTCHDTKGCSLPEPDRRAREDNCVTCHMPRAASSNIVHASVTDHRIPRRSIAGTPGGKALPPGTSPLLAFRSGPHSRPAPERERAEGIALARVLPAIPAGAPNRFTVSGLAEEKLRESLKVRRGDPEAWVAMSAALGFRGDAAGQLDAAEKAARLAPESENGVANLVDAALAANRLDAALDAATSWVGMSPSAVDPLLARAGVFVARGEWEDAEADCRAALRIHPLHPRARLTLGACLARRGDATAGRREADAALGLIPNPRQRAGMENWYKSLTR